MPHPAFHFCSKLCLNKLPASPEFWILDYGCWILLTTYCLLPTAYCVLPTAYYLLRTTYCLLIKILIIILERMLIKEVVDIFLYSKQLMSPVGME